MIIEKEKSWEIGSIHECASFGTVSSQICAILWRRDFLMDVKRIHLLISFVIWCKLLLTISRFVQHKRKDYEDKRTIRNSSLFEDSNNSGIFIKCSNGVLFLFLDIICSLQRLYSMFFLIFKQLKRQALHSQSIFSEKETSENSLDET